MVVRLNVILCKKPQGLVDPSFVQVLENVIEDFSPCWALTPTSSYIFVFQERGYALENSWPGPSCLFFSFPFWKNLLLSPQTMRSWAWNSEWGLPSPQPATASVLFLEHKGVGEGEGTGKQEELACPSKTQAPAQKWGNRMKVALRKDCRNWTQRKLDPNPALLSPPT